MVRVPLGGRRVGGFVVEIGARPRTGLRDLAQVSGRSTIFTSELLETLSWASRHYVAPLGTMLARAAPPNVPPAPPRLPARDLDRPSHRLRQVVEAAADRRRRRPIALLDPSATDLVALASDALVSDVSVLVIAPTSREAETLAGALTDAGLVPHLVTSQTPARDATTAWRHLRHVPSLVVGTPRVAAWQTGGPTVVWVVEESRRAMKERQSPTVSVRELVLARGLRERLPIVFAGPTPSAELVGRGPEIVRGPGRLWPLVEVVDRRTEPPEGRLLGPTARAAIRAVTATGGDVFVYAHRRGFSAATRCVSCRRVRVCAECGSRPDDADRCGRCGAELGACASCGGERFEPLGAGVGRLVEEVGGMVDSRLVGDAASRRRVRVGTERDLVDLGRCQLVILVDADGLVRASNYRASEEALRLGARLASAVDRSGRLLVQTSDPEHHAIVALRRAEPMVFFEAELPIRERFGYPPAGELMIIEARDLEDPERASAELTAIGAGVTVLGPAPARSGVRWLTQGPNLAGFKEALRSVVARWRDSDTTVRVDADPIDL